MFKDFLPAWLAIGNHSEQAGFLKERQQELLSSCSFKQNLSFKNCKKSFHIFKQKKVNLFQDKTMTCIFCDNPVIDSSVEHIVPESLGNLDYVLQANIVCTTCNNNFSEWEDKALTKSQLAFIRIKNAIKTKKGNPSSLQIGNIKAHGSGEFEKDYIKLYGLEEKDVANHNSSDGSFQVTMQDFYKSEMATSKMLLKIGYEALYKSQRQLLSRLDFTQLKNHLTKKDNKDWAFLTSHNQYYNFKSIPTFTDKYNLNKIKCKLTYAEISENIFLFDFKYDYWNLTVNLLNRDYSWTTPYFENDTSASLYPKYLKRQ